MYLSPVVPNNNWGFIALVFCSLFLKPRISIPPYSCGRRGWNQVHPDDIEYAETKNKVEVTGEDEVPPLYQMVDGIKISGERIDLQRVTKVLLKRKQLEKLKKSLAK